MIYRIFLSLSMITFSMSGICQLNINKFSSKISFLTPDKSVWTIASDDIGRDNRNGVLMFKHKPIVDSKGRPVEPIIALIYETVEAKIDVIEYSVGILAQKQYKINRDLLGGYPDFSSDKHSVVFKGDYIRDGVKHRAILGYIMCNRIGLEIIGDCTDEIFQKVETDISKFVKSVKIKE